MKETEIMNTYTVTYNLEETTFSDKIDAQNAGEAFGKCQKRNPGATMLKAHREGHSGGFTQYEPPAVQRDPVTEPKHQT